MRTIARLVMCGLLNQHWYEATNYRRWLATGDNWVCKRCGNSVKSVNNV